eukprot:7234401-Prymnesium_polylepis.1
MARGGEWPCHRDAAQAASVLLRVCCAPGGGLPSLCTPPNGATSADRQFDGLKEDLGPQRYVGHGQSGGARGRSTSGEGAWQTTWQAWVMG